MSTRLTFSPAFAPPETLRAVHEGASTTVADTAADVWAMGVIAYELSTQQPPFPAMVRLLACVLHAILCGRSFQMHLVCTFNILEEYLKSLADVACSTGFVDRGVWLRVASSF